MKNRTPIIYADLHIHSKYSRATSLRMEPETISSYAKVKGISIVGTGDFTHPSWLRILEEALIEDEAHPGFYHLVKEEKGVWFLLQVEVSAVYTFGKKVRKVHHVILSPSFDVVHQINDVLGRHGSLEADGRPTLTLSSPELVEIVKSISDEIEIFPAHAWTPWFGVFGSKSGFDSLMECYQEKEQEIYALETGLSSDPPMNWRLSTLDRLTLISASDSHSPYPYRLGREATVFNLDYSSYVKLIDAIRQKSPKSIPYTIETYPQYGKYHWTGHRNCGVSMSPTESMKRGNTCPVCLRKMTVGVEQRVEELADRPPSKYPPGDFPLYKHLLPLEEILNKVVKTEGYSKTKAIYDTLIKIGGNEYYAMLEMPLAVIETIAGKEVANTVKSLRENEVRIQPGYNGVYGEIVFQHLETRPKRHKFADLEDFM